MSSLCLPASYQTADVAPTFPGVHAAELAAAYALCHEITRERARNFYYGLRLTPEPRRSAIYSIYAWMRAADDEADAEADLAVKRRRLAAFRERTELVLSGESLPATKALTFWPAFAATVRSYPIEPADLRDMLAGLDEDLDHAGYATLADTEAYCYRVGSTPGLTCISIWGLRPGVDPPTARALAVARGKAFQLTNIIRDVAEDFDASPSRVYLPAELFNHFQITPAELRAWSKPHAARELVLTVARRAAHLYDESASLDGLIDAACAPALWGMTRIYRGILNQALANPARIATGPRLRLSTPRKLSIAFQATLRAKAAGR